MNFSHKQPTTAQHSAAQDKATANRLRLMQLLHVVNCDFLLFCAGQRQPLQGIARICGRCGYLLNSEKDCERRMALRFPEAGMIRHAVKTADRALWGNPWTCIGPVAAGDGVPAGVPAGSSATDDDAEGNRGRGVCGCELQNGCEHQDGPTVAAAADRLPCGQSVTFPARSGHIGRRCWTTRRTGNRSHFAAQCAGKCAAFRKPTGKANVSEAVRVMARLVAAIPRPVATSKAGASSGDDAKESWPVAQIAAQIAAASMAVAGVCITAAKAGKAGRWQGMGHSHRVSREATTTRPATAAGQHGDRRSRRGCHFRPEIPRRPPAAPQGRWLNPVGTLTGNFMVIPFFL